MEQSTEPNEVDPSTSRRGGPRRRASLARRPSQCRRPHPRAREVDDRQLAHRDAILGLEPVEQRRRDDAEDPDRDRALDDADEAGGRPGGGQQVTNQDTLRRVGLDHEADEAQVRPLAQELASSARRAARHWLKRAEDRTKDGEWA
jgi:hypothetical protein